MKKNRFDKLMERVPRDLSGLLDHAIANAWWKKDNKNRPLQLRELAIKLKQVADTLLTTDEANFPERQSP